MHSSSTRIASSAVSLLSMLALGAHVLGTSKHPQAHAGATPEIKVEQLVKSSQSWDGSELPEYGKGKPEITVLKITIPAGQRLKTHLHPVINTAVLIQGHLKVFSESGKSKELRAGETLVELVNQYHYGLSLGPEPAVLIVFYAGHHGVPLSVIKK